MSFAEVYAAACASTGAQYREEALKDDPNPHTLILNGNCSERFTNRLDDTDVAALCQAMSTQPCVAVLDLSYNKITARGAAVLADFLRKDSSLSALNVAHNDIDRDGARSFADALMLNMTLQEFNMEGNAIGDEGGVSFGTMLRGNNTLVELKLGNCALNTVAIVSIIQAIQTHPSLKCVSLNKPTMKGPHDIQSVIQHLSVTLRENSVLADLSLNFFDLYDDHFQYLLPAFIANTGLLRLSLRGNKLSPAGGELLATFLARRPELVALDVTANRLGDVGATNLSEAVKQHPCLRQLLVSSNGIGGPGLIALADGIAAATMNGSLAAVTLWGNHFTAESCAVFVEYSKQLAQLATDVEFYVVDGTAMVAQRN